VNKPLVLAFSVVLSGMTAYPGSSGLDSFPFSNYPMFARERGAPLIHQVLIEDGEGGTEVASPELLGTSEVLQAKVLVRQAVGRGRKAARRLCREVAERVLNDAEQSRAKKVVVRAVRYDPIRYFTDADGPTPLEQEDVVHCPVRPPKKAERKRMRPEKRPRQRPPEGKSSR
jgi:hypothetical protein